MTKVTGESLESQGFIRIGNGSETLYAKRENNGITFYADSCGILVRYTMTDAQIQRIEKIREVL